MYYKRLRLSYSIRERTSTPLQPYRFKTTFSRSLSILSHLWHPGCLQNSKAYRSNGKIGECHLVQAILVQHVASFIVGWVNFSIFSERSETNDQIMPVTCGRFCFSCCLLCHSREYSKEYFSKQVSFKRSPTLYSTKHPFEGKRSKGEDKQWEGVNKDQLSRNGICNLQVKGCLNIRWPMKLTT